MDHVEENEKLNVNQEPPPETNEKDVEIDNEILRDETKLELLQNEVDELEGTLEVEFQKDFVSLLSEDEKYMFEVGTDLPAKLQLVESKKTEYFKTKLSEKKSALEEGHKSLTGKKEQSSTNKAFSTFLAENKDVSVEELEEFAKLDMTDRQLTKMREETGDDKVARLKFVYELFKKANPSDEDEDNLPPDLNELRSATSQFSKEKNEDGEYLKSIGAA